MFRTLIERFSRYVVLKRTLPQSFHNGPLFVSPGAALAYWKIKLESVDPALLNVVLEHVREGDIVWDIGANVGLFTFAAANLAGSSGGVLAIEADTWLVEMLRRSSRLKENAHLNVDVLPAAVADSVDIAKFNVAMRGRAGNFLASVDGSTQTGGIRHVDLVPTVSLDWLLERYASPKFVKIDVEGAEYMALKGAERLLTDIRPVILCEVSSKCAEDVAKLFRRVGYSCYDANVPKEQRRRLDHTAWNTLAYPPGYRSR